MTKSELINKINLASDKFIERDNLVPSTILDLKYELANIYGFLIEILEVTENDK